MSYINFGGIDFKNIETVDIVDREMTYRTEEREAFDPVMTNFLTDMDGWQHYETQTVEYEVPNGYEYIFSICYLDGKHEQRVYHESSPIADRLIAISEKSSLVKNINDGFAALSRGFKTGDIFRNSYETAIENFEKMCDLYGLSADSTDEDILHGINVKMTSIFTISEEDRINAICELMVFLLCESKDDTDEIDYLFGGKVNFTQTHSGGTDAFCVLEYGADVYDHTIEEYDNLRLQKGYRKIVLLTVGKNCSNFSKETVLVWDMTMLIKAYLSAFKKFLKMDKSD